MNFSVETILSIIGLLLSLCAVFMSIRKLFNKKKEERYLVLTLKKRQRLVEMVKQYERLKEEINHSVEARLRAELLQSIDDAIKELMKQREDKIPETKEILKSSSKSQNYRYYDKLLHRLEVEV